MTSKDARENRLRDRLHSLKSEYKMLRRRRSSCEELRASREWVRVGKRLSHLHLQIKSIEKELAPCWL